MVTSISFYSSPSERSTVLLQLARAVSSSFAPAELCRAIHAHVTRVLPAHSFTVALAGAGDELRIEYHVGPGEGEMQLSAAELDHLRAGDFVVRMVGGHIELLAGLVAGEHLVGSLLASRSAERPFDAGDAHFLLAVGSVCGAAVENARLFQELSRGRREAELLERVARELSHSLALEDVTGRVVACAAEVARSGVELRLLRGELASVVAAAPAAIPPGGEWSIPTAVADRLAARVAVDHGTIVLAAPVDDVGAAGTLLLPLVADGHLVAVLSLLRPELPPPVQENAQLLERLALHALAAVQNALLHEEVRRLSLTDPLVDLPNRRQLDFFIEKEFAAAQRGRLLCLALFDLDHFKKFNDAFGHQAGDQALIRFADVLRVETRAMNLAARYGGEEFAAVLSDTSQTGAHAYAERVRGRVAGALDGALTVSAGVAVYAESMSAPADLVAAADRALYRAKLEGRNRVCLAD